MTIKPKLAIAITALAAAAFAGGAYAAAQDSATSNQRQAFLDDLAKRLHVTPQQLTTALQGAFEDQLNAAVKAGRLTQQQADALAQRLRQRGLPPIWLPPQGPRLHPPAGPNGPAAPPAPGAHRGVLDAAASYLGLTPAQLLDQLRQGKSLAQVAGQRGKSIQGLRTAMAGAVKARLDKAVAAGRLTSAQERQILGDLSTRIEDEINGTGPGDGPGRPGHGPGRRFLFPHPGAYTPGPPAPGAPA